MLTMPFLGGCNEDTYAQLASSAAILVVTLNRLGGYPQFPYSRRIDLVAVPIAANNVSVSLQRMLKLQKFVNHNRIRYTVDKSLVAVNQSSNK